MRCLLWSKCVRREEFGRALSGIMNIALDFDQLFSPGKEQALKKCSGEQVAWGTRNPGRQEDVRGEVPTVRALGGQAAAWGPHDSRKDSKQPRPSWLRPG